MSPTVFEKCIHGGIGGGVQNSDTPGCVAWGKALRTTNQFPTGQPDEISEFAPELALNLTPEKGKSALLGN